MKTVSFFKKIDFHSHDDLDSPSVKWNIDLQCALCDAKRPLCEFQ